MGKKAKRQFNVRLKEETAFAIQELAERWECSQAEVIERVIEGVTGGGATRATAQGDNGRAEPGPSSGRRSSGGTVVGPSDRGIQPASNYDEPSIDTDMDWGA